MYKNYMNKKINYFLTDLRKVESLLMLNKYTYTFISSLFFSDWFTKLHKYLYLFNPRYKFRYIFKWIIKAKRNKIISSLIVRFLENQKDFLFIGNSIQSSHSVSRYSILFHPTKYYKNVFVRKMLICPQWFNYFSLLHWNYTFHKVSPMYYYFRYFYFPETIE